MTTANPDYQPFVEDYHSDDSDGNGAVLSNNFPRKASPQANVSSKRSKDLNEKPPVQETLPTDLRSDSGYSSYTAASKSSADSAQSQRSPPVAAAPAAAASQPPQSQPQSQSQSPAPKQRRPTGTERKSASNESSPRRQTVSRTPSVSSKPRPAAGQRRLTVTRPEDVNGGDCTDPNCRECGPNQRTRRTRTERTEVPPTASAREFARYPPSDQVSQRSDPNPYFTQTSPTYTREYMQGPAVIKPSTTRRRPSVRQRPQSFAGEPDPNYWVPGMPGYPSPPQEHGPPPSMSAYQNMPYNQMPPYMAGGGPPPPQQPGFFPGSTHQTSPPYEQPRPNMSARGPSGYGQRNYPAPIITDDRADRGEPSKYSARYQQQPPTPNDYPPRSTRQPKLIQEPFDHSESSSSEEESEFEHNARSSRPPARALMPPPDLPEPKRAQSKKRRPTFSHANSTPVLDTRERRRQSIVVERPKPRERERERDPLPRVANSQARRPSISRPPPPQRGVVSEYQTPVARMLVNNSRSARRQSYQGHGRDFETEYRQYAQEKAEEQYKAEQRRQKRSSRNYTEERHMPGEFRDDDDEEEEEQRLALVTRPRRKTDAELRRGKDRTSETKNKRTENAAEEYIKSTRGSREPVTDQIVKAAKKAPRAPPVHSESGSSNSNGSGRQSISQRTNMTNGNNEIRLRVDASAPLALSFNGDMEGRTLQLLPAENGMTDVVIGNRENTYQNERGTVVTSSRRSVHGNQVRREAEDIISERSIRSARSRRERDDFRDGRIEQDEPRGPVLRRIRNTTYHNNR